MAKITLETVDNIKVEDTQPKENIKTIYTFLDRYPEKQDADINGCVYVYKPKGWPEVIQPQYKDAPCHILSEKDYWTQLKWNTINQYSYTSTDWRKRLHYTHWKPIDVSCDGYLLDPLTDYNLPVPVDLEWDTYDWSDIKELVNKAYKLMDFVDSVDFNEVIDVHNKLKKALDCDDCFYLNQWVNFCRKLKQTGLEFN
jgi:hypothetical protein